MDRYIKRIQSRMNPRLKSRGQSITKQQVRDVYSEVVENPDSPTDLEISRVIELLAKQLSSQEETFEETTQNGQLTVNEESKTQEPQAFEITEEDNPDLWATLQTPESDQSLESENLEASGELAITQNESNLAAQTPEVGGITQAQIEEAVNLAIAQTGAEGSEEAKEIMTQLALHLSSDINTLEQAVAALVSGYLNKRSNVLQSAMGALNTLRNAQTTSFCSGLTPDFLAKQEAAKKQLMEIANIFN